MSLPAAVSGEVDYRIEYCIRLGWYQYPKEITWTFFNKLFTVELINAYAAIFIAMIAGK